MRHKLHATAFAILGTPAEAPARDTIDPDHGDVRITPTREVAMPRHSDAPRFGRREFVGVAAASISAAWLAACGEDAISPVFTSLPGDDPLLAKTPRGGTRNPLRIPNVVSASGLTLA